MPQILDTLSNELPNLPKKLEAAAKFALDNPHRMAFGSMRGVATECGVSSPTMLRLARHLGFQNYEDFKSTFQSAMATNAYSAKADALIDEIGDEAQDALGAKFQRAASENIAAAFSVNDASTFVAMAEKIGTANTTHLVAAGSMYWVAAHMEATGSIALNGLRTNRPGTATLLEAMGSIGPGDAVLVIAVSPYVSSSIKAVEYARSAGATIMAITDKRSSPFVQLCDHYLLVPTESPHYHPSVVGVVAVIEALLSHTVARNKTAALKRIRKVDQLRLESGVYVE